MAKSMWMQITIYVCQGIEAKWAHNIYELMEHFIFRYGYTSTATNQHLPSGWSFAQFLMARWIQSKMEIDLVCGYSFYNKLSDLLSHFKISIQMLTINTMSDLQCVSQLSISTAVFWQDIDIQTQRFSNHCDGIFDFFPKLTIHIVMV